MNQQLDKNFRNALQSKLPLKKQQLFSNQITEDSSQDFKLKNLKKIQPINVQTDKSQQRFQLNEIPKIDPARHSNKKNNSIFSYAANTHCGNIRNYNEDRVSIILNIMRPECKKQEQNWPECSFFAIYDGHGGNKCADFLRDQLHQMIIRDENFPQDPKKAISICIYKIEKQFIEQCLKQNKQIEKSGSCLTLAMIVDKKCYVANVGDSRVLLCSNKGNKISNLTQDHKPNLQVETKRIQESGGQIYQSFAKQYTNQNQEPNIIYGPFRVFPGRLSVSRTIGDIEAKMKRLGGNSNCVVCHPDIKEITLTDNDDFLFLGCDGIFDKLSNTDIIKIILQQEVNTKDYHDFSGQCIDSVMKEVLMSKSMDNLTAVLVTLEGFYNFFYELAVKSMTQKCMIQSVKKIEEIQYQQDNESPNVKKQQIELNELLNQQYPNIEHIKMNQTSILKNNIQQGQDLQQKQQKIKIK